MGWLELYEFYACVGSSRMDITAATSSEAVPRQRKLLCIEAVYQVNFLDPSIVSNSIVLDVNHSVKFQNCNAIFDVHAVWNCLNT